MIFIDHISHKCDINKKDKCTHDNYWNLHAPELSAKKAHSYKLNSHIYGILISLQKKLKASLL